MDTPQKLTSPTVLTGPQPQPSLLHRMEQEEQAPKAGDRQQTCEHKEVSIERTTPPTEQQKTTTSLEIGGPDIPNAPGKNPEEEMQKPQGTHRETSGNQAPTG